VKDIERQLLLRFSDGRHGDVTLWQGDRRLLARVDVSPTTPITFDLQPAVTWTFRDHTTRDPITYRFCRYATIETICHFLACYHYQCDFSAITLNIGTRMVQLLDTVDSLGLCDETQPSSRVQAEVRVEKRGFLRAHLRYLHNGEPSNVVPVFEFTFIPKLTIADLRKRIAAIMNTTGDLVQIYSHEGPTTPLNDKDFVRKFWTMGDSAQPEAGALRFTGWVLDSDPAVEVRAWRRNFSRFKKSGGAAGKGTYGTVYRMIDPATQAVIALKVVTKMMESHNFDRSKTFREVAMLIRFNHPCILSIIGWDVQQLQLHIATEFFENGSLDAVLDGRRKGAPTKPWFNNTGIAIIVAGIVLGMRHIHARGAIHRDFRPEKVLIDNDGHPQIADVGLCREMSLELTLGGGTSDYQAPEVLMGDEYGQPFDVFAFGLVLFELIVGPKVFTGRPSAVEQQIVSGKRPPIPSDVLDVSRQLIEGCWEGDPSSRLPFTEVFKRLEEARFQILPDVDVTQVKAYDNNIKELEKACLWTPVRLD
jgi:hypothetical protein